MRRTTALRFRVPMDVEELLHGFMLMTFAPQGIEEVDGETIYYIEHAEWTPEKEAGVQHFLSQHTSVRFLGSETIEDRDWNAEWEATIEPQWATLKLVIAPSWKMDDARAMKSEYLITIDPKMSFGTGHHETTRLCLAAIEQLDTRGKHVLDIGTGTGVLAMYALLRGATDAVGIDTDEWSILNVKENRALNDISLEQFDIRQGTLDAVVHTNEQFDIILANIHRNVLIDIAKAMMVHANPGAYTVLSGLLVYDLEEVRDIYESVGWRFIQEARENEWACLIFQCA